MVLPVSNDVIKIYFEDPAKAYSAWAAKMAVDLDTGVPWIMCKKDDAPDPVINTWNGFFDDWFSPNQPYKPTMWNKVWTARFTGFGGPVPHRSVEDLAFSVAKFIQKGGSYFNYMYHGGTNFGRMAGDPFIVTSYDFDAPIDEFENLQQVNVTRDNPDYLWYTTYVDIGQDEQFPWNRKYPILTVLSAGHSLHVFMHQRIVRLSLAGPSSLLSRFR